MRKKHLALISFLLLLCLSCVKKVTPAVESEYLDLSSTNTFLFPSNPGGTHCSGISLDSDTTVDFKICSYYYGGGQAKQSSFSARVLNGVLLEKDLANTQNTQCISNSQSLKFRKRAETIVTADSSGGGTALIYDYYVGPGTHGVALSGNCSFRGLPSDSIFYIVLRRVEGADLSIGYLEIVKNKITRFRKFRKETKVTLP